MTEAQKILELIEAFDIKETSQAQNEKLDEIDCRVDCFVGGHVFVRFYERDIHGIWYDYEFGIGGKGGSRLSIDTAYTRSRDALKSIRPEGWVFSIRTKGGKFNAVYSKGEQMTSNVTKFPTEELAELHAIIQAIEWERNNE